ncbi:purine-binding chemotaxis protein CheW [Alteromonadaceae bacterium 2753L.S.0a.02]|nr:purine-binding chemotaxis protein CheW [Alteromonadaceae bacterium 2753L.S.0a.02]
MSGKNSAHDSLVSYFDELLNDSDGDAAQLEEKPNPAGEKAQNKNLPDSTASEINKLKKDEPETLNPKITTPQKSAIKNIPDIHSPKHVPQPQPQPRQTSEPKSKAKIAPATPSVEFRELEREKRERLQSLLNSQAPRLAPPTTPAPEIKLDAKIVDPQVVDPSPVRSPQQKVAAPQIAEPEISEPENQELEDQNQHQQFGFSQSINDVLEWAENGRPQWAQSRFDVLLFDVSGLTLAVPLIALGQIQPIGEELTPIFGQSDWFMGLLNTPLGQIRTVNTALFVMPEKYCESFLESAKYVISIDGLPWGLAVDSVNQPITLDPADVKWRTQRTSRPWLAGTVKSAMCALIDIPRMAALLKASEKTRHSLA